MQAYTVDWGQDRTSNGYFSQVTIRATSEDAVLKGITLYSFRASSLELAEDINQLEKMDENQAIDRFIDHGFMWLLNAAGGCVIDTANGNLGIATQHYRAGTETEVILQIEDSNGNKKVGYLPYIEPLFNDNLDEDEAATYIDRLNGLLKILSGKGGSVEAFFAKGMLLGQVVTNRVH